MNKGYYTVTINLFRPHMWPSSEWQEQECSYDYMSKLIHS